MASLSFNFLSAHDGRLEALGGLAERHFRDDPPTAIFKLRQFAELMTSEQAVIVRRIESAFTWIDGLAADATSARKLIDHLDQAILTKAFRGELVPQDPTDEPASVLLDRIRGERAAAPKAKRGRKKAA